MTLTMLATCNSGNCPTIYLRDDGQVIVQGYLAPDVHAEVNVPSGEQLVRIPRSVLLDAVARLTSAP